MDRDVDAVKRAILASGTDDWVHIAEVALAAAQAMFGRHRMEGFPSDESMPVHQLAELRRNWTAQRERDSFSLGIGAVKELVRDGMVRIGEIGSGGFVPWSGPPEAIESRLDAVVQAAEFPLRPGDLFWIENAPLGDAKAAEM